MLAVDDDVKVAMLGLAEHLLMIAAEPTNDPHRMRRTRIEGADDQLLFVTAMKEITHRRKRARTLPAELLGEPGWDILLDLFVRKCQGKNTSITSACTAAQVAPTTALRWIGSLERAGLIRREPDRADQRRMWLHLTDQGNRAIKTILRDRVAQVTERGMFFNGG